MTDEDLLENEGRRPLPRQSSNETTANDVYLGNFLLKKMEERGVTQQKLAHYLGRDSTLTRGSAYVSLRLRGLRSFTIRDLVMIYPHFGYASLPEFIFDAYGYGKFATSAAGVLRSTGITEETAESISRLFGNAAKEMRENNNKS